MTITLSRRRLLAAATSAALLPALPARARAEQPTILTVDTRVIEVLGKPAKVFGIRRPDGKPGIIADRGDRFRLTLANRSGEETLIHWHGQTPPYQQDGVPGLGQDALKAGQDCAYDYPLRTGTHWMHSHHGLQEQRLMAAPLIVRERPGDDVQEVVILLHDFSFTDPAELMAALQGVSTASGQGGHASHGAPQTSAPASSGGGHAGHGMSGMAPPVDHGAHMQQMMQTMAKSDGQTPFGHANDIDYDAYLANDRTLDDPEVVRVDKGGRVRLRIINGATTTAFFIDTGKLSAQVLAVDGNPVQPVTGTRFPLAMGQRIDLVLAIPGEGGAFPVLALREAATERTGVVLATAGAAVPKLAGKGTTPSGLVDLDFEARLTAIAGLEPRPIDQRIQVALGQVGAAYEWTLNGAVYGADTPLDVKPGQRIELTFVNHSMMMHPMHLHGHHFQVTRVGGKAVKGAMRDTVIVPAGMGEVTVAFDADNAGRWPLHCHNLYHMAAGMMTTVRYA